MSKVLSLLVLLAVLLVLRAAMVALALALLLTLTYALITRPAQTLAFLLVLAVAGAANARPLAFITALTVFAAWVVVLRGQRSLDAVALEPSRRKALNGGRKAM